MLLRRICRAGLRFALLARAGGRRLRAKAHQAEGRQADTQGGCRGMSTEEQKAGAGAWLRGGASAAAQGQHGGARQQGTDCDFGQLDLFIKLCVYVESCCKFVQLSQPFQSCCRAHAHRCSANCALMGRAGHQQKRRASSASRIFTSLAILDRHSWAKPRRQRQRHSRDCDSRPALCGPAL